MVQGVANTPSGTLKISKTIGWILLPVIAAIATTVGVMCPLEFVGMPATSVWWLEIGGLTLLVTTLRRCHARREAIQVGFVFATVWLGTTFWWLYFAMHTYGGLSIILTVLSIVALACALSVYYALACGFAWDIGRFAGSKGALVFAAMWTAAEMARGTWLTGFGWGALGYAHVQGPLAAYAPWIGMYGVGALAAWLAATLSQGYHLRATHGATALLIVLLGWLSPAWMNQWTRTTGTIEVALLQGNIAQNEKFETGTGVRSALQWYAEQFQNREGELIVAPETAVPVLPEELPPDYWQNLRARFSTGNQAAMLGIPLGSFTNGYSNSVIGFMPGQSNVWQYDKHHLVPFGEFIPPWFKWFTRLMNIPLGDFNRGAVGQPSMLWKGQLLAPNICYEDLFGEELGARFLADDKAPNIFVNVSNLAWFGDSIAIDQHLAISRMRALEFQRQFVRATNTGATAIVNHEGQIVAQLPRLTQGVLHGVVEGRVGLTPYAWWVSHWGLWPIWGAVLLVLGMAWRRAP